MSADGPTEIEFDRDERYDAELEQLDVDELLADEARDDLELTLVTPVPPRCVVNPHRYSSAGFCTLCGQDRDTDLLEIAARRLREFAEAL